jgi:nitroimidazol reductase NimA-like FMN-containing flavoprotein (pyridoxamine 5'-phosphate oxidase superfamily)
LSLPLTAVPEPSRTRVRRRPDRGVYDRAAIDAILDEGFVCHLGFVDSDQPFVIPTLYARGGDVVYVHGASASRMQRSLAGGAPACLTVTLVDGLVLARAAFHHSVNYRSVVLLGEATQVTEPEEKERALEAFTERLVPGRWADVRPPNAKELRATSVLRMPIDEASAKVRSGPPLDDEEDYALEVWAGILPVRPAYGAPQADPRLDGIDPPPYVTDYRRLGS